MPQLLSPVVFYRRFGIRTPDNLASPERHPIGELALPLNAIYHHVDFDGVQIGPLADTPALQGQIKAIALSCVSELTVVDGAPRRVSFSEQSLIKEVVQKNRKLRLIRNTSTVMNDANTLVCINYNLLYKAWTYVRAQYSEIHKWKNVLATVIERVCDPTTPMTRQHFIAMGCPATMPSLAQLDASVDIVGLNQIRLFNNSNSGILLELWKWLDDDTREKSVFSKIPVNRLHLVNLIVQDSGNFAVINLGYLYAFCKHASAEKKKDSLDKDGPVIAPISPMESLGVKKRILFFFMRMVEKGEDIGIEVAKDDEGVEGDTAEKKADDPSALPNSSSGSDMASASELEKLGERELSEEELTRLAEEKEKEIDEALAQLETIAYRKGGDTNDDGRVSVDEIKNAKPRTLEQAVDDVCMRLDASGSITAAQYRMHLKNAEKYKTIKNPFGTGTVADMLTVSPTELALEPRRLVEQATVHDPSMLKETLSDFDRKYVKSIMPKHLIAMTMAMQKAGYCVDDLTVETQGDITGEFLAFRVSVAPVEGAASTLNFKVPTVDEYGIMRSNDIDYRLKKLRVDIPIRKVDSCEVALTSYYGKCFVYRGRKKSTDYGHWLRSKLMDRLINGDPTGVITGGVPSPGFNKSVRAPKSFTDISLGFSELTVRGVICYFNHKRLTEVFGQDTMEKLARQDLLPIGCVGGDVGRGYVVMDPHGSLTSVIAGEKKDIGPIHEFLGIELDNAPVDYVEAGVMGSDIPVGVILAYRMGLSNLFKSLGIEPDRYEAGRRFTLLPHQYAIRFLDETLVFSRQDTLAALIVSGFSAYHKTCKRFSVYAFDKPAVYLNMFEAHGLSARHLRELELCDDLFVDPITEDLLEEMKEPTNYLGLLVRSCEMLLDDQYKNPTDLSEQRLRGYERIAGAIYTELIRSIRQHKASPGKSRKKLEMNPYSVWKRVFEDPSKELVVQINPYQELRHVEAVTFSGEGGRSKQTMNWESRTFTERDMGVISENSSDSGDVGINTYTSAAPNITNLSGMSRAYSPGQDGATSLFSTSALLSPAYNHEDPKRISFIANQKAHLIPTEGYHLPLYSTGYESIVGQRTSPRFCFSAPKAGKVTNIDEFSITVTYDDGEVQSLEIGRQFGKAAGLTLPNDIVTPLKVGQKFDVGHTITYNTGFFEMDWLNPGFAAMKSHRICRVAIMESPVTFEDASCLSGKFSSKMTTRVTEIKNITLKFTDEIRELVKPGQEVEYDTVLCYIIEETAAAAGGFDDQTLKTLQMIDASAPKAGAKGTVDRIEVFYHGLPEDMSKSIRRASKEFEETLIKKAGSLGKKPHTGSVGTSLRIEGDSLELDTVCIRVYITCNVPNGIGDKGVFSNQLKTVVSDIVEDPMYTEDGREVDGVFGGYSVMKRIVGSAGRILTTNSILYYGSENASKIYFGEGE